MRKLIGRLKTTYHMAALGWGMYGHGLIASVKEDDGQDRRTDALAVHVIRMLRKPGNNMASVSYDEADDLYRLAKEWFGRCNVVYSSDIEAGRYNQTAPRVWQ